MIRLAPIPAFLPATVPFVGPETLERRAGRPFAARLGANENGFGPSPRAVAAMRAAAAEAWKYGDPASHDLIQALAARHGVPPANVIVGEGIDGLLGLLVRLVVAPGEAVVTSDGAYPTFNFHVAGFGGVVHTVPYHEDAADTVALADRARQVGARLAYLANPDNPMGGWQPPGAIAAMLDRLPDGCLLVLDEAYAEFAPPGAVPVIAADDPRVVRMRTFSKAYGLAGARVGHAIGHPGLIGAFDRVRNHFGVNRIGQAGALAALGDRDWLAQTLARIAAARDRIGAIARGNGLTALPSATNFVALDTGRDGAFARRLVDALASLGVFVRMPMVAPLDRCIRVSCAPDPELDLFARVLPAALLAARDAA